MGHSRRSALYKTTNLTFVCLLALLLTQIVPASASRGSAGSEGPGSLPYRGHELRERLAKVETRLNDIEKSLEDMKETIKETNKTIGELSKNTIGIKAESESINKSIREQKSEVTEIRNQLWQLVGGILLTFLAVIGTSLFSRTRNR